MKKEFDQCPAVINEAELYGFSWMEHVMAIPSPLVVVTSYKENGMPNATMQSWCTFTGENGYYCLFASVNKHGHMYTSINKTKQLVINFPSKDIFIQCMKTIEHNEYEDDEIAMSGLTAEQASKVNAPRIRECFLNLECEYVWERELLPNSSHVVLCVKVVNVCMDEAHYNADKNGRYGDTGYLYNIHSPRNPDTGKTEETCVGIMQKYSTYDKL
ncbi:MAG: flavin reductase [Butyricicoccaceae bacterium]